MIPKILHRRSRSKLLPNSHPVEEVFLFHFRNSTNFWVGEDVRYWTIPTQNVSTSLEEYHQLVCSPADNRKKTKPKQTMPIISHVHFPYSRSNRAGWTMDIIGGLSTVDDPESERRRCESDPECFGNCAKGRPRAECTFNGWRKSTN